MISSIIRGVRYGDGIGFVIDIRTKRNTTGYVLGVDLSNSVTTVNGGNTVYAKLNHKNSELGFNLQFFLIMTIVVFGLQKWLTIP